MLLSSFHFIYLFVLLFYFYLFIYFFLFGLDVQETNRKSQKLFHV